METIVQIIVSGLTLGAMYAASAIGLSLVWGAMGVLNMAHGALLTIGGYASYSAVLHVGLPWYLGLPAAMIVSFVVGLAIYHIIFRFMYRHPAFETNVIIATVGLAIFLEQVTLLIYGAYPFLQPFSIEGGFFVSGVYIRFQNVLILIMAVVTMLLVAMLLSRTRMGRAIRATALNREAAQLMGVNVGRVFAQVMGLAGVRRRNLGRDAELDHNARTDHGLRPHAQGVHHLRHRGARQRARRTHRRLRPRPFRVRGAIRRWRPLWFSGAVAAGHRRSHLASLRRVRAPRGAPRLMFEDRPQLAAGCRVRRDPDRVDDRDPAPRPVALSDRGSSRFSLFGRPWSRNGTWCSASGGIFSLAQMAIFAFGGFATGMMGLYLDISLWNRTAACRRPARFCSVS